MPGGKESDVAMEEDRRRGERKMRERKEGGGGEDKREQKGRGQRGGGGNQKREGRRMKSKTRKRGKGVDKEYFEGTLHVLNFEEEKERGKHQGKKNKL